MHPCGLHVFAGKKGAGKSMLLTKTGLSALRYTNRSIVTNLALNVGSCETFLSAVGYNEPIHHRIHFLDDSDLRLFFLHRGAGWTCPHVQKKDWSHGLRPSFLYAYRWPETDDPEEIRQRCDITALDNQELKTLVHDKKLEIIAVKNLPPVQYLIDELQNVYPARSWNETGPEVTFYLSQQRKLRDDIACTMPNIDLLDKAFRDLVDDWLFATNWGRTKRGFFTLPKFATYARFDSPPGKGDKPAVTGTFKIDIEGIGSCYDTSAGVGIEGGLDADKSDTIKGLNWKWIFLFIALLGIIVWYAPRILRAGFFMLAPQQTQLHSVTNSLPTNDPPPGAAMPTSTTNTPSPTHTDPLPVVTGIVVSKSSFLAWLSNGDTLDQNDPRFLKLNYRNGQVISISTTLGIIPIKKTL